jgi:2-octaprenyl-6-methoxyphenol hydroxylase
VDNQDIDILIVGGGLVGASLMLALAHTPYRVRIVDTAPISPELKPDFDARSLALSPASVRILEQLNVWPLLAPHACAIERIHVSEQYRFGTATLDGDAASKLGYVVELQHIRHALHQCLPLAHVLAPAQWMSYDKRRHMATILHENKPLKIKAKLIVAADGTDSSVRQSCEISPVIKDYHQHAIVANIGLARTHHHIAYERFTSTGPLALLPMNEHRAAMIWALPPNEAQQVLALNDAEFLNRLQQAFGYRLGRFKTVGRRVAYPLKQVTMPQQVNGSIVFVGNAAHTLHPVAGQGFNLGLRDVAMLAQCIIEHGIDAAMLSTYTALRAADQTSITRFTDSLIQIFTSQFPGMSCARRMGLIAFDQIPALKNMLARYARGFAGITPDLACNIPLQS